MDRPNLDFSPPVCSHLPRPVLARRTRMPMVGFTPISARFLEQQVELVELLHHHVDAVAELLADQCEPQVLAVLVAVADDDGAGRREGQHRHEFRLAAGLEADAVGAVLEDVLHHGLLLVHLDGVNRRVAALVLVVLLAWSKARVHAAHPVAQDVAEAEQHRQVEAPLAHLAGEAVQVHAAVFAAARGKHHHVAFGVDVEITVAPAQHVV